MTCHIKKEMQVGKLEYSWTPSLKVFFLKQEFQVTHELIHLKSFEQLRKEEVILLIT